jgi:hypothetical protein
MKDFRELLVKDAYGFERVTCANGLSLSIQASETAYSTPRRNVEATSYTAFEIGFPSESIEKLLEYAEDRGNPTNTVYPYVPYKLIQTILEDNGGIYIGLTETILA